MKPLIELAVFGAAQAEMICGVSRDLQRDWRRRGLLPPQSGKATFDLFDLAAMLAMKQLADRGIGPSDTVRVVEKCADGIAWHAFRWAEAYAGDHRQANEARGIVEVSPTAEQLAFDAEFRNAVPNAGPSDYHWKDKAEWLAGEIFSSRGRKSESTGRLFIWWADASYIFADSFDEYLNSMLPVDRKLIGAVVVLDLEGLAERLSVRAGKPFVRITFPDLAPQWSPDDEGASQ